MKNRLKNRYVFIVTFLVLLITFSGIYYFSVAISQNLEDATELTLSEIATQQQFTFDSELTSKLTILHSTAETLVTVGYNEENILKHLSIAKRYHGYENLIVVGDDGLGLVGDGTYVNAEYFSQFMDIELGDAIVTDPVASAYDDHLTITMAAPIIENGINVGSLVAEYPLGYLDTLLEPSFGGEGYAFVIDGDGDVIAATHDNNGIFERNLLYTLSGATYSEGSSYATAKELLFSKTSGGFSYELDNTHWLLEYRPILFNDWSLIITVPNEVVAASSIAIINSTTIFNIVITLGCAVLICTILILRKNAISEIETVAFYDDLTGVPNLVKFKMDIGEILSKSPTQKYIIAKIDIVNFKSINEMYDFEMGDEVIRAFADVGKESGLASFIQARVGIDEFLIFANSDDLYDLEHLRLVYEEKFRDKLPQLKGHNIKFRYGRYFIELGETNVNNIINKVILAHNFSKGRDQNLVYDYDEAFKDHILKIAEITNKMETALRNDEFKVYLQPKFDLDNDSLSGAEALVRWVVNDEVIMFPNDFIPVFESNGFITNLDKHMLEKTCEIISDWINSGKEAIPISVNFSRVHLTNEKFVEELNEIVERYNIPKKFIEIELTESTILDNEAVLENTLFELRKSGFLISIDDFGSGYSSLGLIKNLDIDIIKLDRSFLMNSKNEARGNRVVESVVSMAQSIDAITVAEGVETDGQVNFLKIISCNKAQGYYYAKPMPTEQFNEKYF